MSKFWETCKEDDPMEEDVDMCSLPKFTKSTLFSSLLSLLNDESIIDMLLNCEDNSLDKFVEEREQWNALFENHYNKYRLPEENKEKYWKSRAIAMHFMFSWFIHMHCQHEKPPQIVRLSVTLFHYGVPQPVWRMLHKPLKLCLSYEKTRQFMESACKTPVHCKLDWRRDPGIAVFGADNCAYYNQQSFVRQLV